MGNPLKRFVEFITTPGRRRMITALVILIIAAAVPLTVLVAQQQQNVRQKAAVSTIITCKTSTYTGICSATACSGAGSSPNATCMTYSAGTQNYCCPAPTPTPAVSPTPTPSCLPVPCCYFTFPRCQLPSSDKYCPITTIPPSYCSGTSPTPTPAPNPCMYGMLSWQLQNLCADGSSWTKGVYQCTDGSSGQITSPICVNNTILFAQAQLKCANSPKVCPTITPTLIPTPTPGSIPDCNSGLSNCSSCTTSQANTCSNNGTRTCSYTTSTTGSLCSPKNIIQTCSVNNCTSGYACNSSGTCASQGSATPTASATSSPTSSPNPSGSSLPSQSPSPSPSPTATPIPGNTYLALTIGMDGVGKAGTHQNPVPAGTQNPAHTQRNITVRVLDSNNNAVVNDKIGTINYNTSTGLFQGNFDLGATFTSGNYIVKVKSDGHLRKAIPGIQVLTAGIVNPALPRIDLTAGDINGDNVIDIKDYNILLSCMADPDINNPDSGKLCSTNTVFKTVSDLDDNGTVDKFDYNLFLGEYSVQNGD